MLKLKSKNQILLIFIIIFALFLRLPQIISNNFVFVFDMGRDMLWTRDIVVLHKPYLIGPWGSLQGVFFGPAWYYLLSIPFVITGGDPRGSVYLVLFFNILTIILAFLLGKKIKDEKIGLIMAALASASSLMISISTFAFHSNLLPFTTLVFIWSLWEMLQGKKKYLAAAALMASLNFHLEPATAIFTTLTLVVFIIWNFKLVKNIKLLFISIVAFIIPFVPQIIFELRHQFLQTKSLIAFLQGQNESLGGKLPLVERFHDRVGKFLDLFGGSVINLKPRALLNLALLVLLFFLFLVFKSAKKKEKDIIKISILALIVPFLGYILLFPPELKGWYLYGLSIPFIFLTAIVINFWSKKYLALGVAILLALMIFNSNLVSRINDLSSKKDKDIVAKAEILATQKAVVDWIYKDSKKKPFNIYVYTAPVYEYHYQHLFWWYGKKKHNYWPEEYSYLPGKTDYVPFKERYLSRQHSQQPKKETEYIYLVIEPDQIQERIDGWLGNFEDTNLIEKVSVGELSVEKRSAGD